MRADRCHPRRDVRQNGGTGRRCASRRTSRATDSVLVHADAPGDLPRNPSARRKMILQRLDSDYVALCFRTCTSRNPHSSSLSTNSIALLLIEPPPAVVIRGLHGNHCYRRPASDCMSPARPKMGPASNPPTPMKVGIAGARNRTACRERSFVAYHFDAT